MGRLSEYFRYFETPPEKMDSFRFTISYIEIKSDTKKIRHTLKLYK